MLNKVMIHGRLGKDIETKTVGETVIARFSLACDRDIANRQGVRETDWINCTAFGKRAEFASKYFHKGDQMIVEGRLQVRSYQAQDGSNRTATDVNVDSVYFCGSRGEKGVSETYTQPVTDSNGDNGGNGGFTLVSDDDLPF